MKRKSARYGWIPDLPDQRDHLYAAPPPVLKRLPAAVDLRPRCPPVFDQGVLGSCTANAIGNAYRFDLLKQRGARRFVPSRLFIYYNERAIEGTVGTDAGAMLRDGIKTLARQGVCGEPLWPYAPERFAERPPAPAYRDGLRHQALSYQRLVQDAWQMKGCLASGYPFVFGFSVYEGFESPAVARTGHMPMPGPGERVVGGHAVLAVGYDDRGGCYTCMNSWSTKWGDAGYFYMPYAYLAAPQLARDLWTVRTVEG
ncbi:MAG: C1 family peptidase [Gammaproteobacteria bacterium]|nr:C1 family peptidase [Gammaproteobacteria bacterium]